MGILGLMAHYSLDFDVRPVSEGKTLGHHGGILDLGVRALSRYVIILTRSFIELFGVRFWTGSRATIVSAG